MCRIRRPSRGNPFSLGGTATAVQHSMSIARSSAPTSTRHPAAWETGTPARAFNQRKCLAVKAEIINRLGQMDGPPTPRVEVRLASRRRQGAPRAATFRRGCFWNFLVSTVAYQDSSIREFPLGRSYGTDFEENRLCRGRRRNPRIRCSPSFASSLVSKPAGLRLRITLTCRGTGRAFS